MRRSDLGLDELGMAALGLAELHPVSTWRLTGESLAYVIDWAN